MKEANARKTDRRTRYTRMVIKEALLALLAEREFANITVADLCREAEINRGTFYLHYDHLRQVMDELVDDALNSMNSASAQADCAPEGQKCSYPFCRFLRENRKYRPLFFSDSLHSHMVERIAAAGWESFAAQMGERDGLSADVLKEICYFQINGCLALCRRNLDAPDESWEEIRRHVDRFLKNGLENL